MRTWLGEEGEAVSLVQCLQQLQNYSSLFQHAGVLGYVSKDPHYTSESAFSKTLDQIKAYQKTSLSLPQSL